MPQRLARIEYPATRSLLGAASDGAWGVRDQATGGRLADDLDVLTVHLRYPRLARRDEAAGDGDRPLPRRNQLLSVCWVVLDLVIAGDNRVRFDDLDRQTHPSRARMKARTEGGDRCVESVAGAYADAKSQRFGEVTARLDVRASVRPLARATLFSRIHETRMHNEVR